MMGHATSKTTETYNARKKNEQRIAEAQRVWTVAIIPRKPSQTQPGSNPPLIEKNGPTWIWLVVRATGFEPVF